MQLNLASVRDLEELRDGFYWPIREKEKQELFLLLEESYRSLFLRNTDPYADLLLRSLLTFLTQTTFQIVYAGVCVNAAKRTGTFYEQFVPSPVDFFSWLFSESNVPAYYAEEYLRKYAGPLSRAKGAVCTVKNLPTYRDPGILKISDNITMSRYLEMEGILARPSAFSEWFPLRVSDARRRKTRREVERLASMAFKDVWNRVGPMVSGHHRIKLSLKELIYSSFAESSIHLTHALRLAKRRKVTDLYTATQGYIGTRIISLAVREYGGEVSSFPHAGGLVYTVPHTWMIEPLCTDVFYCYTEMEKTIRLNQIKAVRSEGLAKHRVLPKGAPAVSRKAVRASAGKKVMYLAGGYPGDRFFYDVLPESVRMSLEVSIIDALLAAGCEVTIKLHRKTRLLPHIKALLQDSYGDRVTIMDEPLTGLLQKGVDVDVFFSENLGGGSLVEVMKTDKSVVLVTAHKHLLDASIKKEFHERVRVIEAVEGEGNRLQVREEDVLLALQSTNSHSYAFVDLMSNSLFAY